MSAVTQMSNLSHLPHDLMVVIAKRLKKLEDFLSFSCVSKSSFAAVKDEYFEGLRVHQRTPYLLLPVRDDGDDDVRELYSLVEGESIVACTKAPNLKIKRCFESLGWLLAIGEDGNMSLLEPFSDIEIPLPHQSTFPRYNEVWMLGHIFIQKMVLSSSPNEDSDFVLMVICGSYKELGFWRIGDKSWNKINSFEQKFDNDDERFDDVVYDGNGRFYATSFSLKVWVFNVAGNDNQAKGDMIIQCDFILPDPSKLDRPTIKHPMTYYSHGKMNMYLLNTNDKGFLIIIRMSPALCEDGSSYITTKFVVFEVDTMNKSCEEIHSIGSMAVFVGSNSTVAVDASRSPGGVIKPNRIYFTEDDWEYFYFESPKGGGIDMGAYNLDTGTVESIYPGETLYSKVSPALWINPCI